MEQDGALARWLAAQARANGLDALSVEDAPAERLRDYCRAVLGELAARGLVAGPLPEADGGVGCHAAPRSSLH